MSLNYQVRLNGIRAFHGRLKISISKQKQTQDSLSIGTFFADAESTTIHLCPMHNFASESKTWHGTPKYLPSQVKLGHQLLAINYKSGFNFQNIRGRTRLRLNNNLWGLTLHVDYDCIWRV